MITILVVAEKLTENETLHAVYAHADGFTHVDYGITRPVKLACILRKSKTNIENMTNGNYSSMLQLENFLQLLSTPALLGARNTSITPSSLICGSLMAQLE